MRVDLRHGDCVELMRVMPECSVDSIVTDPPYELGFMGKAWDGAGIAYSLAIWGEALRVLKPGGHLLAFGGTRTYHRMACAIEEAGFEIRDSIHWVYGSGFPKSLNVGKAIDKAAGAEREVVGALRTNVGMQGGNFTAGSRTEDVPVTVPATDEAKRWEGWGTALKPAHEPVVVARKPLSGTVAGNVLTWGTGALNIDGCRVQGAPPSVPQPEFSREMRAGFGASDGRNGEMSQASGRWPANIVLDGAAAAALDQQSGVSRDGVAVKRNLPVDGRHQEDPASWTIPKPKATDMGYGGTGGASRFFTKADFGPDDWPFVYQAKPSKRERNAGLDGLPEKRPDQRTPEQMGTFEQKGVAKQSNHHPTVKPVALMRHLVRLVTPPGGTVLDPFAGSGTTLVAAVLEGMNAIGCEMTDEYLPIIRGRVAWAEGQADEPDQPRLL